MRELLVLATLLLAGVGHPAVPALGWQVPAGAKIYSAGSAAFTAEGKRLKAVFYYKDMQWGAVTILSADGREVASSRADLPHGLTEPTGLHHLKGNASVQVVLFGRVGAKLSVAQVYDFEEGKLRRVFDWGGWDFQILALDGKSMLAVQDLWRGTLTDLYLWRDGAFTKANELFPEFYAPEIAHQTRFIREADGPFATSFSEACRLAAEALLYSRRYAEAIALCQDALVAVNSRCCSGASSAPPEVVSADRGRAEEEIRATIERIRTAEGRGSKSLGGRSGSPIEPTSSQTNLVLSGDLAGDGRILRVEFYHRGPVEASGPGQPPLYVRGVRIMGPQKRSVPLAKWESQPTSILVFNPQLNKLWAVPEPGGKLITAAVQYGGRVVYLHGFRWDGEKLKEVGKWGGEDFSIKRMGRYHRLVVVAQPSDHSRVSALYAWNGTEFQEASAEFPEFYRWLGASQLDSIRASQPLPAVALVQSCRLALQAYQLAGTPSVGRDACLEARDRIASGREIVPGLPKASPEDFNREKDGAISDIHKLLAR